jgi:hypothetical protein
MLLIVRREDNGYAFLPEPETMSIIAVAAYSNPPLEENNKGEVILSKKIAQHTRHKIQTILNMAIENGKFNMSYRFASISYLTIL